MGGRAGPVSRVSRSAILRAAHRHFVLDEPQAPIAEELGVSASYLARLLREAKAKGWVRVYVDADRATELAGELLKKHPSLVHAEVVRGGSKPEDTARELAVATSAWFDDLVDRDQDSGENRIRAVALGGSMMLMEFARLVARRPNGISVGPTALPPPTGRFDRVTPLALSFIMGDRLGALAPGSSDGPPRDRLGFVYGAAPDPDFTTLETYAAWLERWSTSDAGRALDAFWSRVDVTFAAVAPIDMAYAGVADRLGKLGLSLDTMKRRGAVALLANRFIDADGKDLPLAPSVLSYEPVMSTEALRACVEAGRYSVLEVWGKTSPAAMPALRSGLVNVVVCDVTAAECMLR